MWWLSVGSMAAIPCQSSLEEFMAIFGGFGVVS
jgi:hypothetical protein